MVNFFARPMKRILHWLYFNFWYLRKPPWDTGVSPPELIRFIQTHPPGRALDLGCGTGTNAIALAQQDWKVTAIDFAPRAVNIARKKASNAGVKIDFLVRDVTSLDDFKGPYDLILDIGCFHGLSKQGKSIYIQNLERLLSAGGAYLMYGFFKQPTEVGSGLVDDDIDSLLSRLNLETREDGTERGVRPSSWFLLRLKK